MKPELFDWMLASLCAAAAIACASADPGGSEPSGTGGVASVGGVSGASGGASHSGGAAAGVVGGPGATVTCGSNSCKPPSAAISVYACCMADNTCGGAIPAGAAPGLDFGGAATSPCLTLAPGKPDASCKSYKSSFGVTLPGCCGSDHVCGVDLSVAGLGCNNVAAIASDAPAPVACSG